MRKVIRLIALISLIIRKGKFSYTGLDHSKQRLESLKGLEEFFPAESTISLSKSKMRKFAGTYPFMQSMWSELAFIKHALSSACGHITLPQRSLCYVRIPKAASTALGYAILVGRYPGLRSRSLSPEKINYLMDVNLGKDISAEEKTMTFFTVVRNPFARIVSVYREFFENHSDNFIYQDYVFGILRGVRSFGEFVRRVRAIPDRLKDQHLKPQHHFLTFYEERNIRVELFQLEEPASWKNFLSHYPVHIEPVHVSAPYDYRSYYDEAALQAVFELYARDVSRFGYEPAYHDLKQWIEAQSKAASRGR